MTQAAKYILTTEYKFDKTNLRTVGDALLAKHASTNQRTVYKSLDESSIVELRTIDDLTQVKNIIIESEHLLKEIKSQLTSDVRRQVLTLVEEVKAQNNAVPNTHYLQLRHIEVPLNVHEDYLQWRQRTIFSHVKKQSTINSFVAYHSLISTEPGVMFLSGFNGEIDDYKAGFESPDYKEIVKEAGTKYIAGGERGLYTTLYQRYDNAMTCGGVNA